MKKIHAIAAAPGICLGIGRWICTHHQEIQPRSADPRNETQRLETARDFVRQAIMSMHASLKDHPNEAAIFEAHRMMLDDPDLLGLVEGQLHLSAEYAWYSAIQHYANQMEALQDEYLQARASDIRDVGRQVLDALQGGTDNSISSSDRPIVILAKDLTPSQTSSLDKSKILGFVTQEGSSTSHTSILARTLGIPAVVGVGADLDAVQDNDLLILDGTSGEIVINPDEGSCLEYTKRRESNEKHRVELSLLTGKPATTLDGNHVEIVANIGSIDDARSALDHGAEGVGLLRTEFLYMERNSLPSEEDQFQAYRSVLEVMENRPVVFRTLDIGGDKYPPYMDLGEETNPFLGWRAIRVCLDHPEILKTQLRAMLRAATGHNVRLMFPMIATLEELRSAKSLLREARMEINFRSAIQVGMMVEVPSVVQLIDLFSREVDFFSIGTNDLTQYTFAVDRTNARVSALADACHPAILRQIHQVVEAAHSDGHWVGVCGELAGDIKAIPILVGLGVDELSMSSTFIPAAKETVRRWSTSSAIEVAREAIAMESAQAVRMMMERFKMLDWY